MSTPDCIDCGLHALAADQARRDLAACERALEERVDDAEEDARDLRLALVAANARAEAAERDRNFERVRANEWLAQLHDSERDRIAVSERAEAAERERDEARRERNMHVARLEDMERLIVGAIDAQGPTPVHDLQRIVEERAAAWCALAFLESPDFGELERRHVGGGYWHKDEPELDVYRVGFRDPSPNAARVLWTDECETAAEAIGEALEAIAEIKKRGSK